MTPSQPDGLNAYREFPDAPSEVLPFDARELLGSTLLPHRTIELVLVERARFVKTVASGRCLPLLAGVMVFSTLLFALPYGLVLGVERSWRVAALYLGSVALCFPSLHVFSNYLGCRMRLSQNLIMALIISSVASMFALGFAPIVWFIGLTTPAGSIAATTVSAGLLSAALFAGLGHLGRTFLGDPTIVPSRRYRILMCAWQGLLLFVAYRMGVFLELV